MIGFPKCVLAAVAVSVILLVGVGRSWSQQEAPIPLEQAVRQGLVKVDVTACGGAYGDAVQVAVQRLVPRAVHVVVEPGTVFVSVGGDVQNMAGARVKGELIDANTYRPTEVMVLADGTRRSFLLEAYCLDYEKPEPKANDGFRLAARDGRAARILVNAPGANVSVEARQSALWMDRAGVSAEELRRTHGFAEVDVRVGGDIVRRAVEIARAAIPPGVPVDVRVHIEGLLASDPAVRGRAAARLREMGPSASVALPFLVENSLAVRPLRAARPAGTDVVVDAPGAGVHVDVQGAAPKPAPAQPGQPPAKPQAAPPAGAGVVVDVPGAGVRVDVEGAAAAVQAMMKNRPIEPLVASLKSPMPLVRRHAARTLGLTGNPGAILPLITALGDSDPRVKELAAESLSEITGQDLGVDRPKWMDWWEKNKQNLQPKPEAPAPKPQAPAPKPQAPAPQQ